MLVIIFLKFNVIGNAENSNVIISIRWNPQSTRNTRKTQTHTGIKQPKFENILHTPFVWRVLRAPPKALKEGKKQKNDKDTIMVREPQPSYWIRLVLLSAKARIFTIITTLVYYPHTRKTRTTCAVAGYGRFLPAGKTTTNKNQSAWTGNCGVNYFCCVFFLWLHNLTLCDTVCVLCVPLL